MAIMKIFRFNLLTSLLVMLFSVIFSTQNVMAQRLTKTQKANFTVLGNCSMCKERIETAVLDISGVKYVSWNAETKELNTIYNRRRVDLSEIHKAIAHVGHDTPLYKAQDSTYQSLPLCCLYERKDISVPKKP